MSVAAFARRREARDADVGMQAGEVPPHIGQDGVVAPNGERFLRRLRVAEVDGPCEVLLASVDAPRGEKLLRAEDAEQLALFVADEVLSAVAARHRQVAGA